MTKRKKNKFLRRLPLVGIFLLLVLGVSFFLYPILSNWVTENSAKSAIKAYDEAVQKMGYDAINRFTQQAEEYNRALAQNEVKKVSSLDYDRMLAVTDAIGYIEIPKIGVYYPIYHGLSDSVLQKGIGHMEGSSLPVGGQNTHCVLAGHTGLPSSKLFTDLDTLTQGDLFYIHVLDKVMKYRVDQIRVVLPYQIQEVGIEKDNDYGALVTGTPYGGNDHRLLVRGTRVKESTVRMEEAPNWPVYHEEEVVVPVRTVVWYSATSVIVIVIVGVLVILLFPTIHKRRKNKSAKNTAVADTAEGNNESPHDSEKDQEE